MSLFFICDKKRGWLVLWNIVIVFGILSTPAAAPSSIEGMIYSKLPLWYHLVGLPEILLQTLAFSFLLVHWEKRLHRSRTGKSSLVAEWIGAIATGCFAYIGYAVGAITSLLLLTEDLDMAIATVEGQMEGGGAALKTQFMFIAAFMVNVVFVFGLARRWRLNMPSLALVFLFFWLIDTAVPLVFQWIFLYPSTLPMALWLGFVPAAIITASMHFAARQSRPNVAVEPTI